MKKKGEITQSRYENNPFVRRNMAQSDQMIRSDKCSILCVDMNVKSWILLNVKSIREKYGIAFHDDLSPSQWKFRSLIWDTYNEARKIRDQEPDPNKKLKVKFDSVSMCLKIKNRVFIDFRLSVPEFLQKQTNDLVFHKGRLEVGAK